MLSYINSKIPKKHKDDQGTTGDAEKQPTVEVQEPSKETTKHKHKHAHHHDADDRPTTSSSVGTPLNPVLEPEDEHFLEQLLSEDGSSPPLPPRSDASHLDWSSDSEVSSVRSLQREEEIHGEGKGKDRAETSTIEKDGKDEKKTNRLSALFTKKKKNQELQRSDGLEPEGVSKKEGKREKTDITQVLSRLNLSAKNNKVVQLSNESSQLLQRFTQIFKDLVNGVPTAYDDLTNLIEDRDGAISRSFDKLPSSLKKLVMHLPEKLTSSLAPEILLAAAESQGIKDAEGGMKEAAKKMFLPQNLSQLVTKPGALVSMLRAIVEALKARWPAFLGMNVIWSIALSCECTYHLLLLAAMLQSL